MDTNTVLYGDCRQSLRTLADAGVRVQCCVTSPPYWGLRSYLPAEHADKRLELGLEPTYTDYVANMVGVFRLVRQLLADDGVLWLNLGDCYATGAGAVGSCPGGGAQGKRWADRGPTTQPNRMPQPNLKPKDLVGIPWRMAFALQADGWWLRQDIIWHKPAPIPESVRDRCTKSHEYIFLLAKSEQYYFDQNAILEPSTRTTSGNKERKPARERGVPVTHGSTNGAVAGSVPWEGGQRNKRSVWTIPSQSYPEAHFATFPAALIEPCILAGSRPGDIILDPFLGSGTTAQVAQNLGRRWIGCELNPAYSPLIDRRIAQAALSF